MDSKNTLKKFKTLEVKAGYVTISMSRKEIVSDLNEAYKVCRILNSPHSTELANTIAEILGDELVEYTGASKNGPVNLEELKRRIINVSQRVSETMQSLNGISKNNCETMKLLWTINQHFQKYEAMEGQLDSVEKDDVASNNHNKRERMDEVGAAPDSLSMAPIEIRAVECNQCISKAQEMKKLIERNKFLDGIVDSKIVDEYSFDEVWRSGSSAPEYNELVLLKENEALFDLQKIYEVCILLNSPHSIEFANAVKTQMGDRFVECEEPTTKYALMDSERNLRTRFGWLFASIRRKYGFFIEVCKNPTETKKLLDTVMQHYQRFHRAEHAIDLGDRDLKMKDFLGDNPSMLDRDAMLGILLKGQSRSSEI